MKRNQPEFELQKQVCAYIRSQYPNVLFMSDTIASLQLTMFQKMRNKAIQKQGFHCPDIIIFEPRNGKHGLFLELKVKSPFKKNGDLLKNEHLENQHNTIQELISKGYYANFAVGFEDAKRQIDQYMKG